MTNLLNLTHTTPILVRFEWHDDCPRVRNRAALLYRSLLARQRPIPATRCVKWAVDHLLPPEFDDASFVYQLSSSAGLTKLENELNVHLWFITEQSYSNDNLRAWGRWWNAKQQQKIIDPASSPRSNPITPVRRNF